MKKLIALLMAAIMMLSLVACSSSGEQEPVENETPVVDEDVSGPAAEGEGPLADDMTVVPDAEGEGVDTPAVDGETLGTQLNAEFVAQMVANPAITAQEMADAILAHESILFSGASMPVEPGLLTGFGETEITGFEEGVMFAPMIGTIPFVGYIFTLAEDADVDAFVQMLSDNANPRWNVCTEAEEMVIDMNGSTVFFLMCPLTLEE
ncbi:MAG: hypothetical protein IJD21_08335 [Oscillospiraceae bacterium]|nr:hypothetical protein [Oscillospiraceae bacterium]